MPLKNYKITSLVFNNITDWIKVEKYAFYGSLQSVTHICGASAHNRTLPLSHWHQFKHTQLHIKDCNPSMCSLLSRVKRQSSKQESSKTNLIYLTFLQTVTRALEVLMQTGTFRCQQAHVCSVLSQSPKVQAEIWSVWEWDWRFEII